MNSRTKSSWNIPLGTLRGVPIQVHGSFFLLIGWVIISSEGGVSSALIDVLFLLSVFFCVLLHECGHVFTGQFLDVKTRDITLYPFGGIATLLTAPTAGKEFIIASAGPLVSLLIAGILYLFCNPDDTFLVELSRTNLALAIFNLIPAIPMDGGRIFRSLLLLCNVKSATTIAARISQGCSILLGIFGFFTHSPILIFISFFVFLGAVQELLYTKTRKAITGKTVEDLMVEKDKLFCFQHGTTLTEGVRAALRSLQEIFPVVYNDELLGLVSRQELIEAVSLSGEEQYIAGLADRNFISVSPKTPLEEVVRIAQEKNSDVIVVRDGDTFIGLVFLSNIGDVMIVDSFKNNKHPPIEDDFF